MIKTLILLACVCAHLVASQQLKAATCLRQRTCNKPEVICESCNHIVACVGNPDGSFSKTNVGTCTGKQTCNQGACTDTPNPFCEGVACLEFPCQQVGIFPDPFFCNKFVMCVRTGLFDTLTPFRYDCDPGFQYNAVNGLCDLPLADDECPYDEYPVPLCSLQSLGDSGIINPGKPELYYRCERYSGWNGEDYPKMFICSNGTTYSANACNY